MECELECNIFNIDNGAGIIRLLLYKGSLILLSKEGLTAHTVIIIINRASMLSIVLIFISTFKFILILILIFIHISNRYPYGNYLEWALHE